MAEVTVNTYKTFVYGEKPKDALGVPVEFSTREHRKTDPIKEMRAYRTYHQI